MNITRPISLAALALLALTACQHPTLEVGPFTSGAADLNKPVFVGGTLLSGYRNGSLTREAQETSVAAQLSLAFMEVTPSTFSFRALDRPGGIGLNAKPWESIFQAESQLGDRTDCKGVVSLGPVKDTVSITDAAAFLENVPGIYADLCIPKATTADLTDPAFGTTWAMGNTQNPFYGRVATNPTVSTPLSDALAQQPTFTVLSTGWDEILQYAQHGATGTPPPDAATFATQMEAILSQLASAGSKGAVCGIPPLEAVPFFTTIPWNGLNLDAHLADSVTGIYALFAPHISFEEGPNGFVVADPAAPVGLRQLVEGERLLLTLPLDSVKCQYMGLFGLTIPDRYELQADEVAEINAHIDAYNAALRTAAADHGFAYADLPAFFTQARTGVYADGVKFTTEFVSGNIFSLDGVTLTGKGAALVANEIIKAVNLHYSAAIPLVQVYAHDGVRFP